MDTSLTPLDLFSPSKAAQHRAQAQDWAFIETWLAAHYRSRARPPFERNDDTLKALLALAAANEKAEEEAGMLNRAEREALTELLDAENALPPTTAHILTALRTALPPSASTALPSLASTSTLLSTPSPTPNALATSLLALTSRTATLSQHLAYTRTLHTHLTSQLAALETTLQALQNDRAFTTPASLPQRTAEYVRQTRHLRAKLGEYAGRVVALGAEGDEGGVLSCAGIAGVVALEEEVEGLAEAVGELEARVDAFRGLPAGEREAGEMVKGLEAEVRALRGRRNGLFEGLVD